MKLIKKLQIGCGSFSISYTYKKFSVIYGLLYNMLEKCPTFMKFYKKETYIEMNDDQYKIIDYKSINFNLLEYELKNNNFFCFR